MILCLYLHVYIDSTWLSRDTLGLNLLSDTSTQSAPTTPTAKRKKRASLGGHVRGGAGGPGAAAAQQRAAVVENILSQLLAMDSNGNGQLSIGELYQGLTDSKLMRKLLFSNIYHHDCTTSDESDADDHSSDESDDLGARGDNASLHAADGIGGIAARGTTRQPGQVLLADQNQQIMEGKRAIHPTSGALGAMVGEKESPALLFLRDFLWKREQQLWTASCQS